MKNPNGYGSVVKLSGNRRRPFTARKTTGWKDNGQPIYLVIGYYASREEGMIALAEYNKNPYDIDKRNISLNELYQKWSETVYPKLGKSLQGSLKSAYKHMKKLDELKYRDIRSFQMQDTIDNCGCGYIRLMVRYYLHLTIVLRKKIQALVLAKIRQDGFWKPWFLCLIM